MMLAHALALGANNGRPRQSPESVLCQAAKDKARVTATYKGKAIKLEPYAVFKNNKSGALELAAVDADKKGNRAKLDNFPLADLAELSVTSETFVPTAAFNPELPPYRDHLVCPV